MGILTWLVVGVVAGVVASFFVRRPPSSAYLALIAVAFVGAAAGGFATNLVTRHPVFSANLPSLFVAVLGAGVFLAVFRGLQRE
jgi:uncharacterized membrane protein YeaQ/YmgE (transglycosylase-associated protein family)